MNPSVYTCRNTSVYTNVHAYIHSVHVCLPPASAVARHVSKISQEVNIYFWSVCLYVCTWVCGYVCMCVRMHVCTSVRLFVCMCVRLYVCVHICTYVCM